MVGALLLGGTPNVHAEDGKRPRVPDVPADILQALDTTPPDKLAILSFEITEDKIPTSLLYQLQDGFVLGLVRNGVKVIDHEERRKRLLHSPELAGKCDTSVCLKKIGEKLRVRFAARIEIAVTGNSYRMAARIFRTSGTAPAALPIDTQSRFCDICTVTEARDAMLRLAESIRVPDEPNLDDLAPQCVPAPIKAPSTTRGWWATGIGVAAIMTGTIVVAGSDAHKKAGPMFGGALMGLGAASSGWGLVRVIGARQGEAPREETDAGVASGEAGRTP